MKKSVSQSVYYIPISIKPSSYRLSALMAKSKGVRLRLLAYLRVKISSSAAGLVITLGSTIVEILAGCVAALDSRKTPLTLRCCTTNTRLH